jgi:hypothetical protein
VITTSVGLASNFISFFLIENKKIGRWMLLFVGIIVMTLCMLGLGITDVVAKSDFSQAQGSVLVALVSIFLAASTIGPGVLGVKSLDGPTLENQDHQDCEPRPRH